MGSAIENGGGAADVDRALTEQGFQLNVLVCLRDTLNMYGHCLAEKYAANPYLVEDLRPAVANVLESLERALRETEKAGKHLYEYLEEMRRIVP